MTQTLPAFLQNYKRGGTSTALDSLTKMSTGAQPYISIQGNRFRAIDAVGDEQMIGDIDRKTGVMHADVVIIDANEHVSKVYYASSFDPQANEYLPPDCWSDNGIAPSSQATSPQCRTCAECPLATWGSSTSKLTGKQTKACNDVKKVAVYVPELPGMGAFLLRVPPASLKELANYARTLAANGANVAQVITRVSFKPDGVGMMTFNAVNWISEENAAAINELDDTKIDLLINRNDTPRTGELPAPAQRQQLSGPGQGQGNGTPAPSKPPEDKPAMFEQKPAEQTKATFKQEETRALTQDEIIAAAVAAALAKAGVGASAPAAEPAKRTRRTKEQIAADEAAKASGGAPAADQPEEKMEVPAFLNGGKAGATTPVVARAGGQPADEPSPELQDALNKAFSLNLNG